MASRDPYRFREMSATERTAKATQRQANLAAESNRIAAAAHKLAKTAILVSLLTAFGVVVAAVVAFWTWSDFAPPK